MSERYVSPAVVLGLNPNGLGTVRALARAGVPVIAVGRRAKSIHDVHRWMSTRTRLARKAWLVDDDELMDVLLHLGPGLDGPGVLMPAGDFEVLTVSRNREALSRHYRFAIAREGLFDRLFDKIAFAEMAAEHGVSTPATLCGLGAEELAAAAGRLLYPVVIKPYNRDGAWDTRFGVRKGLVAADEASLLAQYGEALETSDRLVVQEIVPGPDSELEFTHFYLDRELRVLAGWTGHKVRQLPVHFGTSSMAEVRWNEESYAQSVRFLQGVGVYGYSSLEFKRDRRDGKLKAMEVTAGRTWYPHYAGVAAGVNIPLVWYREVLGLVVPPQPRQRDGLRWVDEYRDVVAALDYIRGGELTVGAWLTSYRPPLSFAHLTWRDPLPGLFLLLRFGIAVVRGVAAVALGVVRRVRRAAARARA